jgi:hypothetical protein
MLYAPNGQPIRKSMQVDAYDLPDGAIVSKAMSIVIHNKIANDTLLRERLEQAQRERNARFPKRKGNILHLAMLKRGEMSTRTQEALVKNAEFGEKVARKRMSAENLKQSARGYEGIKLAV